MMHAMKAEGMEADLMSPKRKTGVADAAPQMERTRGLGSGGFFEERKTVPPSARSASGRGFCGL